ncbi:MAG: ATP-binding protein [Pseudomonadota bacterium]|nr:ATP-binding protein [Pseudomonadota bacterium]
MDDEPDDPSAPSVRRQKTVLWLIFAALLLASFLAFYATQRLVAASSRVEQSQELLTEIGQYISEIKDVENGGRAYYLTGDQRYLEGQRAGITSARATQERLRRLATNRAPRQKLDNLFRLADDRIGYSLKLVAQRDAPNAALQSIDLGTRVMDRLRREAASIIASENAHYRLEREDREGQAWLAGVTLAATVVLCLLVIAWLFSLRGKELDHRRQLQSELRQFNLELEDRAQARTEEARRAAHLFNAVIENLPDMILLKEPAGDQGFRYLLVNAAGEKLLGRPRSEIIGKTERDLFPPDEAAQVVETNKAVMEAGETRTYTDRKLTTPKGVRTVETRLVPITNGNGRPTLLMAIIRDTSDARAREEQLRQLQRMDAIGRLTGGVAHDFNNLLAVIYGNGELIRDTLEDGTELAEMTDDIIGAAGRGAEMVKRLLAYARMQHLEPDAIDLNARLPSMIGLLQRSLGENVQVQVRMADGLWPATIDPTQVDDALLNLAINARDAMPEGGKLTIETQNIHLDEDYAAHNLEVRPGDYVMLAVSDTGTGMPPDVIARAFEPFFTTKEEGKGTGLGLSQIFGWVKQSGGHIKIYSEVGHGTTIKLYLPRAESHDAQATAVAETVELGGDETILVVEDNPNVRKTVIRQLHDLGYETLEADSGSRAMDLIEEGAQFDLLLSDVVMPGGVTGYQLVDELRRKNPELKVLFTSGYTELARSSDQPVQKDPLLSKPYRKQDLGRAVRAVLDQPRELGTPPPG